MKKDDINIGFLASHSGSNFQAIVEACHNGCLDTIPKVLICNNKDALVISRAKKLGIPSFHLSSQTHPNPKELDAVILKTLRLHDVNIVILAGYMKMIGAKTLNAFAGRILNTHPALLPKYGGKGMYGDNVHKAVLEAGETETGITIHIVDKNYDTGPIVNQCKIPIRADDNLNSLKQRVLKREYLFFIETLQLISSGKIKLSNI